jgi:hypothetical protein
LHWVEYKRMRELENISADVMHGGALIAGGVGAIEGLVSIIEGAPVIPGVLGLALVLEVGSRLIRPSHQIRQ